MGWTGTTMVKTKQNTHEGRRYEIPTRNNKVPVGLERWQ